MSSRDGRYICIRSNLKAIFIIGRSKTNLSYKRFRDISKVCSALWGWPRRESLFHFVQRFPLSWWWWWPAFLFYSGEASRLSVLNLSMQVSTIANLGYQQSSRNYINFQCFVTEQEKHQGDWQRLNVQAVAFETKTFWVIFMDIWSFLEVRLRVGTLKLFINRLRS